MPLPFSRGPFSRGPFSRGPFSRASIVRIVCDLLCAEVTASRGRALAAGFDEATRLGADGIDLDSLERLDASAALNEFFHLHEYGAEDYLLALPTVGEWCDLVEQSLAATGTHLTFRTSGSTGEPNRCTHAVADLSVEVDHWASTFKAVGNVIALVPSHHIYGTIFSAMLPDRLGVDCTGGMQGGAGMVMNAAQGTLVVGTPTQWSYLSRSMPAFPPGLTGTTSTAPFPAHLAHRLQGQRLERLVEIYGSSETGGIASRERPQAPFALLGHWRRNDARIARTAATGELALDLPDNAQWLDDRHFAITGRRDGAVQIGGHNVFPERVREQLLGHAGVADAAVRLEPSAGRLKAFIVPAYGSNDTLVDDVDAWCGARLRAHERPRRFTLGDALPRNAMGKLADW